MSDPIAAASAALQSGQRDEARRLLVQVIQNNPSNARAWFLLSQVLDDPAQKQECLARARTHGSVAPAKPAGRAGSPRRAIAALSLLVLVAVLAFGGYAIVAVKPQPAPPAQSSAATLPTAAPPAGMRATQTPPPAPTQPPALVSGGSGRDGGYDPFPDDTDNDGSDNDVDDNDDSDTIPDTADNCPLRTNPSQADVDADGKGDECDDDADGDELLNQAETILGSGPLDAASRPEFVEFEASCTDGRDNDLDGTVDGADQGCIDTDNDTNPDLLDNCPTVAERNWRDQDQDGRGDVCDPTPLPPNTAPSIAIAPAFFVDEGSILLMDVTGSDAEDAEQDLLFLMDFNGDGVYSGYARPPLEYDPADLEHDGPGVHVMKIQVQDTWELSATAATTVTIRNLPPAVDITPPASSTAGNLMTVSGQFTDPGALDTHTALWNWGDGQSEMAAVREYMGSGTVSGSHIYAAPGTYEVTLTVTDDDGDSQSATVLVVVR